MTRIVTADIRARILLPDGLPLAQLMVDKNIDIPLTHFSGQPGSGITRILPSVLTVQQAMREEPGTTRDPLGPVVVRAVVTDELARRLPDDGAVVDRAEVADAVMATLEVLGVTAVTTQADPVGEKTVAELLREAHAVVADRSAPAAEGLRAVAARLGIDTFPWFADLDELELDVAPDEA